MLTTKIETQFHLILCMVLGVFLAFPSNARAGFPRIQSALKQLENALVEANPTAPPDSKAKLSASLNTALKLLQTSYDAKSGHHARAIQDVQFAIGEADKGDLQHLAKDYITQAIAETKAALAEYSSTPSTTTFVATASASVPSRDTPTVKLSTAQTQAVVLIKGDHGEGTGFLVKTADGPAVITNLHVLSNNPNLKIFTNTGQQVTTVSLKGAVDRDLAMFAIKDQNYSYLDLAADVGTTVQTGDQVVTPGNSGGGEVMLNTGGKVLGIGPDRIEISNPVFHGNSGGPVFHTKSGQVVGVVSMGMPVMLTDDLDRISFESGSSAIAPPATSMPGRAKTPTSDLNNFRLLFELRAISVGVIVTKSDELRPLLEELGIWSKYGTTTTWMSKLLPRIEGGGGGGCPLLVFGIKRSLYEDA